MDKPLALITGASSGIGESLAQVFADNGHDLIVTARREARLAELAETLRDKAAVTIIPADLSTARGPQGLAKTIEDSGVAVDVLVNNAGIATHGPFHDMTKNSVGDIIDLNVRALTQLTHALLPGMLQRGRGRILNVASVVGFRAVPAMSVYSASKAYVLSFTESLAEELRFTGVTATAVCPGLTKTDMVEDLQASGVPEFLMSRPEDVAREAYAACMRGDVIHVPGPLYQAMVAVMETQPRWLTRTLSGFAARAGFIAPTRR